MYPTLIEIGDFPITTFGLMIFLSFISGAWILSIQLERRGYPRELAWDVLLWLMVGGLLAANFYYLSLHWRGVVATPVGMLLSRGGLVWYGGLIGGILAGYWQIKRRKLPLGPLFG